MKEIQRVRDEQGRILTYKVKMFDDLELEFNTLKEARIMAKEVSDLKNEVSE